MNLIDLEITTSGFNILKIKENEFDVTTAFNYDADFFPIDGGITVIPNLEMKNNLNGRLLIRQICLFHRINVSTLNCDVPFELKTVTKDTIFPSALNFKIYTIKEGDIYDEFGSRKCKPVFFDSLQQELFSHWTHLDYKIEFQTFYLLEQEEKQIPIFSFSWSAEAICEKIEESWNFSLNRISTEQEIRKSVQEGYIKIPDFGQLRQLKLEVENHFNTNKELQKK